MGRLDVPDKQRDFVSISMGYLSELYDEIDGLKKQCAALEESMALLLHELAMARLGNHKPVPPVYRERKTP